MKKLSFIPMNLQLFAEDSGAGGGVAAPQESTSTESSSSTESTSTGTESGEPVGGETGTQASDTDPASQKAVQTPEQNAAFADLRRKAEAAERRAMEVEEEAAERRAMEVEAQRQRDIDVARKYGQYGIYSDADVAEKYGQSHGVKTVAEFEIALRNEEHQARLNELKDKGVDPELVNRLVGEHPAIKEAMAYKEAMAQQQAAMQKAQEDNFLVSSFEDLRKEYGIKGVEDVSPDVWGKWQLGKTGLTLPEAYLVVNHKNIVTKQAEAAKQATLNNIQGKDHVRGNGKGTEVDTTRIPDEVLEMYKKFNPGKSMDEYKKHYKSSL